MNMSSPTSCLRPLAALLLEVAARRRLPPHDIRAPIPVEASHVPVGILPLKTAVPELAEVPSQSDSK
jgi:hypothetical protein